MYYFRIEAALMYEVQEGVKCGTLANPCADVRLSPRGHNLCYEVHKLWKGRCRNTQL